MGRETESYMACLDNHLCPGLVQAFLVLTAIFLISSMSWAICAGRAVTCITEILNLSEHTSLSLYKID